MYSSNIYGSNVVILSALIGILLANALDDGSKKIAGSAFMIVGLTLFTMSYGCTLFDTTKPLGIDPCYAPNPCYPAGYYQ